MMIVGVSKFLYQWDNVRNIFERDVFIHNIYIYILYIYIYIYIYVYHIHIYIYI